LYRVLPFRGKLKLDTITSPGVELSDELLYDWRAFLKVFWSYLKKLGVYPLESRLGTEDLLSPGNRIKREKSYWYYPSLEGIRKVILTSGPNTKRTAGNSVISHGADCMAWVGSSLYPALHAMCLMTGNIHFLDSIPFALAWKHKEAVWNRNEVGDVSLGKLSIVEEPGKLRIVAMVDSITQWVLYPLHKALFAVLRKIPQDGTFDQVKPIKVLLKVMKEKGLVHLWSFDLSAATDRIPVVLQELTLVGLTGPSFASVWKTLLCDRWYRVPELWVKTHGKRKIQSLGCGPWPAVKEDGSPDNPIWLAAVRYEVGQPMGAYSSWAMLALVHHAIVQYAAWKAGHREWFSLYAVLGDDIVIGDHNVADQYVRLMEAFGVGIGFYKSVISNNLSLEFAKRFFYKGEEVTPLPLVGIATGWLGASFVPEVVKISETVTGNILSNFNIGRYLGIGFKASSGADNKAFLRLPRLLSRVLILLSRPNSPRGTGSLYDWVRLVSLQRSTVLDQKGRDGLVKFLITWARDHRFPALLRLMQSNLEKFVPAQTFEASERLFEEYAQWFKDYIRDPLAQDFEVQRMEVEAKLRGLHSIVLPSDNEVATLLEDIESFEEAIAAIPTSVLRHRSQGLKDAVAHNERMVKMVPASVKRWRLLRRFMDKSTA
jgi:hypothetical protein